MCDHHGDHETCELCEAPPQLAVLDADASPQSAIETSPSNAPAISHIAGILSGYTWTSATLSFGFTTSASQYARGDAPYGESTAFTRLSDGGKAIFRDAISQWDDVSGLRLTEASSPGEADIRIAGSGVPLTAWAYYPNEGWGGGGDIWANTGYIPAYAKGVGKASGAVGTYAFTTALHEVGHALGLEHSHEGTALDPAYDSMEYTVMSYKSFVGHASGGYTNEAHGYAQSLMMLDIAAIQAIYGADHTTRSGDTTYSFNPASGEMKVDGAAVATPAQNRIFRTLWDGDGFDTLDFALYTTDIKVDLNPGGAIDLDAGGLSQKSRLGYTSAGWVYASANIYMSLLHDNDTRSLIEAVVCGSGDDVLIGNSASNLFCGGLGADTYTLGAGNDVVQGTLAQLLGDTITDFQTGDRVVATDIGSGKAIKVGGNGLIRLVRSGGADDADGSGDPAQPGVETSGDPRIVRLTGNRDQYVSTSAENLIVLALRDNDRSTTGSGNDRLIGGGGNDKLRSGAGNDTLEGGSGKDRLYAGAGDDVLVAGDSRDQARGRTGDDILFGNDGADRLYGNRGSDSLSGGNGDDRLLSGRGGDLLYGGSGSDLLTADKGSDLLYGGAGSDVLEGGKGADLYVFHAGDTGTDTILKFEFGSDRIEIDGFAGGFADLAFTDSRKGVSLEIGAGAVFVPRTISLQFEASDFVFFTDAHTNPRLPKVSLEDIANSARTTDLTDSADAISLASSRAGKGISLNDGDDRANAGAGSDTIDGGAGDDTIRAGGGGDLIIGGSGNDDLGGGGGRDVFVFRASDLLSGQTARDILRDFAWERDTIRLTGFEDASIDDLEVSGSGRRTQIVVDDAQIIVFSNLPDHEVFRTHDLIEFA
jgi:serralysin